MTPEEKQLLVQQRHFREFMASKDGNTTDLPPDDSDEAWQWRSVLAATPDEIFG